MIASTLNIHQAGNASIKWVHPDREDYIAVNKNKAAVWLRDAY